MNLDSASSISSGPVPPNLRKERGAIAAQACETCRSRKQKCDEQRPKCGLCQRMKLVCSYREPQPTKKDKTLTEILDRLTSLENKVDRIPTGSSVPVGFGPPQPPPTSQPSSSVDVDDPSSYSTSSVHPSQKQSPDAPGRNQQFRYATAAHKILTWPAMQQVLLQALPQNIGDLKRLELDGSTFIVRMQNGTPHFPMDEVLQERPFMGMQTRESRTSGGTRLTFPSLTREKMHHLATAYFDTFNFMYPFMDRQNFISDTLSRVCTEGFDGDPDSVTALLVFALGELAIEGSGGDPIEEYNGRPSGVRGGTATRPPGLAYFNEARKRIGFVFTECELENVQIFSLAALYCESCSRYADFWRWTIAASLACQVLIKCNPIDWNSPKGDLIKRAYWHCVIMETAIHHELDLPLSGITGLEDQVGIPNFNGSFCEADHRGNQASHFEEHYASQVALRRLNVTLNQNIVDSANNSTPSTSSDDFTVAPASLLKQLVSQLVQWRGMLPRDLQWPEDDPASFPIPQPSSFRDTNRALDPNLSPKSGNPKPPLFTTNLDGEPVYYQYAYDIQVALLRTKYYYAKYMINRPFVYKAMHFPEQMTNDDAEGVAECLRSCLKWPITMSPTSRRKRLIPYLFCWSQNFLGILLIFHMTSHNAMLRDIRTQLCGARFEAEVDQSVELMLDWIRDLKSSDPIAMWCWKILQGVYHMDP